jgi:alanyl-tRNA synthetase
MVASFARLYYEDSYSTKFTATVISCHLIGSEFAVVLDQTAFYPEGGGQPADTGVLGDVCVLDVHEKNGTVYHATDRALGIGCTVAGIIDWDRRFMLMQQHSGEHILSGVVKSLHGYDNVGFQIGTDTTRIDFSGFLTHEELTRIEQVSNQAIYQNIPIEINHPTPEERQQVNYRSKIELDGDVRIVRIPGTDCCACCGTHVKYTGEIGLIKILSSQKYKGGTRLSVVCGIRALTDYIRQNEQTNVLSSLLSLKPDDLMAGVLRLQGEIAVLKAKNRQFHEQIIDFKLQSIDVRTGRTCLFEDDLAPDELRAFCLKLVDKLCDNKDCEVIGVFSGRDEDRYRYVLISKVKDMRTFSKKMNAILQGTGGGNQEMAQGSVAATHQQILDYFANSD